METKNKRAKNRDRRDFLLGIIPASCCLLSLDTFAQEIKATETKKLINHKFDNVADDRLTYREQFQTRFDEFISSMKFMSKEIGMEKVISLLKKRADEKAVGWANRMLQNSPSNDMIEFAKSWDMPIYDNTLTFEFVERTDKVCEVKVTECLWAQTYKNRNAGEIGYANHCHMDYKHPQSFNKNIKLIRTKTLMQGHDCCNHRYVLES